MTRISLSRPCAHGTVQPRRFEIGCDRFRTGPVCKERNKQAWKEHSAVESRLNRPGLVKQEIRASLEASSYVSPSGPGENACPRPEGWRDHPHESGNEISELGRIIVK